MLLSYSYNFFILSLLIKYFPPMSAFYHFTTYCHMPFSLGKVYEVSWLRKRLNWLINEQLSPRTWVTRRHYVRVTTGLSSISPASCFMITLRKQTRYFLHNLQHNNGRSLSLAFVLGPPPPRVYIVHKSQTRRAFLGSLCASASVWREDTGAAEQAEHLNTPLIPGFGFLAFI